MISTIQYEKLFRPYTRDGHTLEMTMKYLTKEAAQRGILSEVLELAVNEIFAQVANGHNFSLVKCSCGCGIDKAATDLIHAIRDRMFDIDKKRAAAVIDLMQDRYKVFLAGEMKRISKTDKEFIKMNRPPIHERSEFLRGIKWIISLLPH